MIKREVFKESPNFDIKQSYNPEEEKQPPQQYDHRGKKVNSAVDAEETMLQIHIGNHQTEHNPQSSSSGNSDSRTLTFGAFGADKADLEAMIDEYNAYDISSSDVDNEQNTRAKPSRKK